MIQSGHYSKTPIINAESPFPDLYIHTLGKASAVQEIISENEILDGVSIAEETS